MIPSSLASYGGVIRDYAEVVDPTTDEGARFRNRYVCDVGKLTQTAPRALVRFVGHGTAPYDPVSGLVHRALWGDSALVKPTKLRVNTGVVDITWPPETDDDLTAEPATVGGGLSWPTNFQMAFAELQSDSHDWYRIRAAILAPNIVRVRMWDAAGTPNDLVDLVVGVWIW
jgi:hypothetical protein